MNKAAVSSTAPTVRLLPGYPVQLHPRPLPRCRARQIPRTTAYILPAMIEFKLASLIALISLLAAVPAAPDAVSREEIMRAMLCLTGAMGGGILGMSFNPAPTVRQNLLLIFVNFLAGVCFSPLLVEAIAERWSLRAGLSLCLAVGAAVAALAVLIIKPCLPVLSEIIATSASRFRNKNIPPKL